MQVPVYIWAPEEEGQFLPGRCSRWWSKHSVLALQDLLQNIGSRLIVRRSDDSAKALMALVLETGAQALYFNHLYDPISLVSRPMLSTLESLFPCSQCFEILVYSPGALFLLGLLAPWFLTASRLTPARQVRDHEVKTQLGALGVLCRSFNADLLYEPWEVMDPQHEPFTNYQDFWYK